MVRVASIVAKGSPSMTAMQQARRLTSPDLEQRRKRTRREPTKKREREVKEKRRMLINRFDCIKISSRSCWEKQLQRKLSE